MFPSRRRSAITTHIASRRSAETLAAGAQKIERVAAADRRAAGGNDSVAK